MMNIIGILCITLAINSWGKAMFDLDTYPAWANATGVWSRSGCRTWSSHALPPHPQVRDGDSRSAQQLWISGPIAEVRLFRDECFGARRSYPVNNRAPTGEGQKAFFYLHCTTVKTLQNIYITLSGSWGAIFRWISSRPLPKSSFPNIVWLIPVLQSPS